MSQVRIRAYCHGLGDCHLVEIAKPAGGAFWMLIDCGIHTSAKGGKARIDTVVADIRKLTGHLDVVVATHEHWDHISGFATADWSGFSFGEAWLAWTENPDDAKAQALDKFKGDGLAAIDTARAKLNAAAAGSPALAALAEGVDGLRGFFGIAGERSRGARDAVVTLTGGKVRYLEPGTIAPLPAGLGVTAYVLGPPRDDALFRITDSDNRYRIADSVMASFALAAGTIDVDQDIGAPFDATEGAVLSRLDDTATPAHADFLRDRYLSAAIELPEVDAGDTDPPRPDQGWRRIDGDWLGAVATLALQLDDRTNNTSLVLALAMTRPDEVALFAADAQIGNWSSWGAVAFPDGTTGPGLLARTSFYKVGHHGSGNATMQLGGLEAMTRSGLRAFVPTDQQMAQDVGWGAIPEDALMARLAEKGTVIRSDKTGGELSVDFRFGGEAPKRRAKVPASA